MKAFYFEDYKEGMVLETGHRTVLDYDISAFVNLCAFHGPMFMDMEYVTQSKYYSGRLSPGLLALSLAEGLIIDSGMLKDRGLALMELSPKFLKPTLAGDTIYTAVTVTDLYLTSRGDRGIVTTDNSVLATSGKEVIRYKAVRSIKTKSFDES